MQLIICNQKLGGRGPSTSSKQSGNALFGSSKSTNELWNIILNSRKSFLFFLKKRGNPGVAEGPYGNGSNVDVLWSIHYETGLFLCLFLRTGQELSRETFLHL